MKVRHKPVNFHAVLALVKLIMFCRKHFVDFLNCSIPVVNKLSNGLLITF